jgi:ribosome-associated heat shock protein Hsp15
MSSQSDTKTSLTRESAGAVRADKWLWAARFFKTRALAAAAVNGGKVHVNGARAKPAKPVCVGDRLDVQRGFVDMTVVVRALDERRGPAARAATLYEETDESRVARERRAAEASASRLAAALTAGRPTKRDRRAFEKLSGRHRDRPAPARR